MLKAVPVVLAMMAIAQAPTLLAQVPARDTVPAGVYADTGEYGRIVGVVTDSAMRPLDGARVSVVGTNVAVITDREGRFRLVRVPTGLVILGVRRLGYRFRFMDVDVTPGDAVDGSVVMTRSAQMLDTVNVTASRGFYDKPPRLDYTSRYDDFYARRRMGFGRSVTREQIEAMHVSSAIDVITRLPFLRVAHTQGDVRIYTAGGDCRAMQVFIDGQRTSLGAEIVDMMNASDIEAVEVYRSPTGMPAQAGNARCAVFVWTR